ncbi:hypothetical protein K1719_017474 [Acacia pycnantha]|nr:hypothetical protein K1719_017474 [Acacia pycnantha]
MMVAAEATIGVNNNHDMVTSYGDIDSTQLVGVSDLWKQRGEARSLSYTRCLEGLSFTNNSSSAIESFLIVGVHVMLVRNIDQTSRLCNGTRLQITQLGKNVIKAKALNGTSAGQDILIYMMDMNPCESKLPFKMTRR